MRCRRLPPVEAMLRSCCDAPARIALASKRIARRDLRVIGEVAVGDERADTQAAILRFIDLLERQMRDVDQSRRARDVFLHEVDQIGAAGDELCVRVDRDHAHGVGDVARARIVEIVHRPASPRRSAAVHHLFDRRHDVGIGAAPADIAAHQLADLIGRARVTLGDQPDRGTDLPGVQ